MIDSVAPEEHRYHKTLSRSSPFSASLSYHQEHCSKKTKKSHDIRMNNTVNVNETCQSSNRGLATMGEMNDFNCDSFTSSLSLSSPSPPPLQHQQVPLEFQFLVKLRDKTYCLCFPVWRPPSTGDSVQSTNIPQNYCFLMPSAWQICALLSCKTCIPTHLLQLDESDMPRQEMRHAIDMEKKSVILDDTPAVYAKKCHVFFLTAKLKLHIRGGKGGFGSLLKGQSKQAAAKTTVDFGACRDLSGRRLRHINDEIKLRKWREALAMKARGEPFDEEQHYKSKSGIENWYLNIPNWAMEAFSNKARRANERRIRRQGQKRLRSQELSRSQHEAEILARDRSIMAYASAAVLSQDDTCAMEQAVADGIAKRRRQINSTLSDVEAKFSLAHSTAVSACHTSNHNTLTMLDEAENTANIAEIVKQVVDTSSSTWFCTLSGDFITDDQSATVGDPAGSHDWLCQSEIRIQARSDFSTGCVLLPDCGRYLMNGGFVSGKWYYEVQITESAGLAQIGWANDSFEPSTESGDGVGDDCNSFGYDGSRALIFHKTEQTNMSSGSFIGTESSERPYGTQKPWKAQDVVGCMLDADDGYISYSLNGSNIGLAFHYLPNESKGLFPALSLNGQEIVLVRIGPNFDFLPSGFSGVYSAFEDEVHRLSLLNPKKLSLEKPTILSDCQDFIETGSLDLEAYKSSKELERLGLDRLKFALIAIGAKCGGTLQERAARLFSLKGVDPKDFPIKARGKNFGSLSLTPRIVAKEPED